MTSAVFAQRFSRHLEGFTRRQAFLTHFGISLAIFAVFMVTLLFFWYPGPFFNLEGGWSGIRIVAFVDVVLGPCLTLVIYKPGKPGLKFDMSLIILAQLAALIWGGWTVSQARPALIVFSGDAFYTVAPSMLEENKAPGSVYEFVGMSPKWIYTAFPDDPIEKGELIVKSEKGVSLFFDRYRPMERHLDHVISQELPISHYLGLLSEKARGRFDRYMEELDRPRQELAFFPLVTSRGQGIIAIEREAGRFVRFFDVPYHLGLYLESRKLAKSAAKNR